PAPPTEVGAPRSTKAALKEQLVRAEAALDKTTAALMNAEVERRELEKRHACAIAAERATFADREARLIAELANIITVKDTLTRQIAEPHQTSETLRQQLESKNATLDRLGQRERELETLLADAAHSGD